MLGVILATGFGAAPPAYGCTRGQSPVRVTPGPARSSPAAAGRDSALVAVRMGWAVG